MMRSVITRIFFCESECFFLSKSYDDQFKSQLYYENFNTDFLFMYRSYYSNLQIILIKWYHDSNPNKYDRIWKSLILHLFL